MPVVLERPHFVFCGLPVQSGESDSFVDVGLIHEYFDHETHLLGHGRIFYFLVVTPVVDYLSQTGFSESGELVGPV